MTTLYKARGLIILALLVAGQGTPIAAPRVEAAGVWYVATTGNDAYDCVTPVTPCGSINGALAKATDNDIVYVATGTYYHDNWVADSTVVSVTKDVSLLGGWNSDFSVQNGMSTVDGESLWAGIGIYHAYPTGSPPTAVLIDRFIVQHTDDQNGLHAGGGIVVNGILTLTNSVVRNNVRTYGGAGISNVGTLVINNSTIGDNFSDQGGAALLNYSGGTTVISNSTISGNSTNDTGGGIRNLSGSVTLKNTILAGNMAVDGGPNCSGAVLSAGYNLIGSASGCGYTTSTGDLLNVNAGLIPLIDQLGIIPLLADSPAINAGNPTGCTDQHGNLLATDQRGVARVGRCDLGAYEYTTPGAHAAVYPVGPVAQTTLFPQPFTPLQTVVVDNDRTPVPGVPVLFEAPPTGGSVVFSDTGAYTTTALTAASGIATTPGLSANGIVGSFQVTASAAGAPISATFTLTNSGVWYVAENGNNANDCITPATPCGSINGALEKAVEHDLINVASGTYKKMSAPPDWSVVTVSKDITLLGGWNVDFSAQTGMSIVDGEWSWGGVYIYDTGNPPPAVLIDRFIVQHTDDDTQHSGGGIDVTGILTLTNSVVRNNVRTYGGAGISNVGTLVINNSTISGNTSDHSGGAIWNHSGGTIIINNSTISGNATNGTGGGIYNGSGVVTLKNTILAGNMAVDGGPECGGWVGSANYIGSAGYNLIGTTSGCSFAAGTGDIFNANAGLVPLLDPLGFLPLLADSPAIDAGNPAGCTDQLGNLLATDQRGVARVGVCDLGAYEYASPGAPAAVYRIGPESQITLPSQPFTPLQAVVVDDNRSPVPGAPVLFEAPPTGASAVFSDTGAYTTTALTAESGIVTTPGLSANGILGSFEVTASAADAPISATFALSITVSTAEEWYAATTGNDAHDCATPATPCATINGVLAKAADNDIVYVAAGTYTRAPTNLDPPASPRSVVAVTKDISLLGGWNADFSARTGMSIVDGQGLWAGIYIYHNDNPLTAVLIDHFIVQNTDHDTGAGGGIDVRGVLTLTNSVVRNNNRLLGGAGISNAGTLVINNSTLGDNVSHEGGGAIVNHSGGTTVINNSTISRNTTTESGGGIYNISGSVTLKSTIMAGNTAHGGGPDCTGDIVSAGYNLIGYTSDVGSPSDCRFTASTGDIFGNTLGDIFFNIGLLPLLDPLGIFPLRANSPAVDAGNPAGCTDQHGNVLVTDQRGMARVGRCDIGAYEYNDAYGPQLFLPSLSHNHCRDFFDDFSNPGSGWPVTDDSFVRSEYLGGEYRVLSKQSGYIFLFRPPGCPRRNYTVATDMRWAGAEGESYGLIFGLTSNFSHYYMFYVSPAFGEYALFRRSPSGFAAIQLFTSSAAVLGTNHLQVTRNGNAIVLELNGVVLGTWNDSNIGGETAAGLYSMPWGDNPTSDARIDNFSVVGLPTTAVQSADALEDEATPEVESTEDHERWPQRDRIYD